LAERGVAVLVPKYDTNGITSLAVLMERVGVAVEDELRKSGFDRDATTLVVVGQSLGGIAAMNLHAYGWTVAHAVAVGSPLRGARFVDVVRRHAPLVSRLLRDPTFDFLLTYKLQTPPPHSFHTISCGLFSSSFDGCVYRDEATLDRRFHTHEPNLHHVTGWATLQLWRSVWAALEARDPAHGARASSAACAT
jgi:pimeloyl-ACP methyl ester carboxylesterase